MGIYRIYRRFHDQTVDKTTKTMTHDPCAAEIAFRSLMKRTEFWATRSAAVLSLDNRGLEFRRFDSAIPIDEGMAADLRNGRPLPSRPRVLTSTQGGPKNPPADAIVCYLDWQRRESLVLDDSPIRLAHDD